VLWLFIWHQDAALDLDIQPAISGRRPAWRLLGGPLSMHWISGHAWDVGILGRLRLSGLEILNEEDLVAVLPIDELVNELLREQNAKPTWAYSLFLA